MVEKRTQDMLEQVRQLGKRYRYPVLILVLGIMLMLLSTGKSRETLQPVVQSGSGQEDFDLEGFTQEAEELLAHIRGAGKVRVVFSLATDGSRSYVYDETTRQQNEEEEREVKTVLTKQSGDEMPLWVTRSYPTFRGAAVSCQGGDDPQVVLGIKEAISSLTGLGMDKIAVLKMD